MRVRIKLRGKLQAGPGVKINKSDANTLVRTRASTESGGAGGTASSLLYEDATIKITIDAGGIKLLNKATNDYAKFYTTGALGVYRNSSGEEFTVAPSDLATTGSIIPRLTGLYDGGVPMSAYVLRGTTF